MVKRYRKQRQHIRKYNSGKSTTVNKGVLYKEYKTKGQMSQNKREIFKMLSEQDFETGGFMDFGRRGLERSTQNYGNSTSVEWYDDPDFEVSYHTHPKFHDKYIDYANYFPSVDDIEDFWASNDSSTMILHNKAMLVLSKTDKFKKMKKKELNDKIAELEGTLLKDIAKRYSKEPIEKFMSKAKNLYSQLGINVTFIPKNKKGPVTIPVKVVERVKPLRVASSNLPANLPNLIKARDLNPFGGTRALTLEETERLARDKDALENYKITTGLKETKKHTPKKKIVGKGRISLNNYIQETIESYDIALEDLSKKKDLDGVRLVQKNKEDYLREVGLL